MSKLFAAIFAAMFALGTLGTVSAFAADKGKGDEKKVAAKAKADEGKAKADAGKAKAAAKKDGKKKDKK